MPLRLRNLLLLTVLCAGALTSWYLRTPPEPQPRTTDASNAELGYYLADAVFSGLNADGRVVYRLAAARIEESPESDLLSLQSVEISYADEEEVPWLIRAQHARSPHDRAFIELDTVTIESTNAETRRAMRIEAEDLLLEPEVHYAGTSGPVRLEIDGNAITAIGLRAYLKEERITLESQVHAEFSR